MTKRLSFLVLAVGLVAAAVAVAPTKASAQEVQITGPLAGAPACRHCRIYRQGRISLNPFVGFTLQDEFSRAILFGIGVEYHLTDWLGIGGLFGYGAVQLNTPLTDEVGSQGVSTERNRLSLPSRENFEDQVGNIVWFAAPQVTFVPLRGKLALFQKVFIDADAYFHLGVAIVGIDERADVDEVGICSGATATPRCLESQTARASRIAFNATFGAGMRLYINDIVAVTFEWRGMPFAWNTSGTDESGDPRGDFPDDLINEDDRIRHFNQMVLIGAAIYLPTEARVSE